MNYEGMEIKKYNQEKYEFLNQEYNNKIEEAFHN